LLLLWAMVFATIFKHGFQLPSIDPSAFSLEYLPFTLGGYVRILAVMTGIEVFANLVAAYDGEPSEKSNMAFKSLLIIMGTTGVTMIVVGPAIFSIADTTNAAQSVFTQTMDYLLPDPLPWIGTIIGVAVLMSASAASAQGLQNLALGLHQRRYIPQQLGHRNKFDVADKPVWIEVAIVSVAFLFFGTHEETYLAIYAAGVFILLSMTGWAVTQRLIRELGESFSIKNFGLAAGTVVASLLTTVSTVIIFQERFFEGAWTYFLFIPLLYYGFTYFRLRLGAPAPEMEYLGRFNAYQLAGFGFGQANPAAATAGGNSGANMFSWQPDPIEQSNWREEKIEIKKIAVLLDGSEYAAQALPTAEAVSRATQSEIVLLSAVKDNTSELKEKFKQTVEARQQYLDGVVAKLGEKGMKVKCAIKAGFIADATKELVEEEGIDLVVTSTRGKSGSPNWETGGVSNKLVKKITRPVLLVQTAEELSANGALPDIDRIMVTLDGSIISEEALPYARFMARVFSSELLLLSVPAVPEEKNYRAPAAVLRNIRRIAENNMQNFLDAVARSLKDEGIRVRTLVKGNLPARTIVSVSQKENTDMIVMTSHGRGGLDFLFTGSVAERVVEGSESAVFMIPIHENSNGERASEAAD
ncbi:MAG: universal stress protein, partial [Anaerolineae bacterium]|nr:universal stress protein [Anaerolineae bacterium]